MNVSVNKNISCECSESFISEDHLTVHEKKHDDIMLSIKSTGTIFVSDQTPTPTGLIKNCEEVGLFEDLQHVNPFDETFRRAVEQKTAVGQTPQALTDSNEVHPEEDSLHTPQVYPMETIADNHFNCCADIVLQKSLNTPISSSGNIVVTEVEDLLSQVDGYKTTTSRQNSGSSTASSLCLGKTYKYRNIVEKPIKQAVSANLPISTSIQVIQPQLLALKFGECSEIPDNKSSDIPLQFAHNIKPLILPKLKSSNKNPTSITKSITNPVHIQAHEPSSASLTPTSQLPIKERLKAILNHNNRTRVLEQTLKPASTQKSNIKYNENCMERRRAAASRYRNKIRNEQKELLKKNADLHAENEKLKQRINNLEKELAMEKERSKVGQSPQPIGYNVPGQIQIPPSTVHFVMNIPKIVLPLNGQPIVPNTFN